MMQMNMQAPFGGRKQSGQGKEFGEYVSNAYSMNMQVSPSNRHSTGFTRFHGTEDYIDQVSDIIPMAFPELVLTFDQYECLKESIVPRMSGLRGCLTDQNWVKLSTLCCRDRSRSMYGLASTEIIIHHAVQ
jgi:hypothetical protein